MSSKKRKGHPKVEENNTETTSTTRQQTSTDVVDQTRNESTLQPNAASLSANNDSDVEIIEVKTPSIETLANDLIENKEKLEKLEKVNQVQGESKCQDGREHEQKICEVKRHQRQRRKELRSRFEKHNLIMIAMADIEYKKRIDHLSTLSEGDLKTEYLASHTLLCEKEKQRKANFYTQSIKPRMKERREADKLELKLVCTCHHVEINDSDHDSNSTEDEEEENDEDKDNDDAFDG